MKLAGEKMKLIRKIRTLSLIIVFITSFFLMPLNLDRLNSNLKPPFWQIENIHSSAETVYNQEWLKNNNFSTQDHWVSTKGAQGDNSTIDASISGGSANYVVVGDEQIKEISAPLNDGTWVKTQNDIFLYPDTALITSDGCYVDHDYDESVNQTRNYHSVHWKKNVSIGKDMSRYSIDTAALEVIFNATVNVNVDTANDNFPVQFGIGDFATFYVLISDLDFTNPYRVANNKTSNLGQDFPTITTITDKPIETVEEEDIITALSSSLEKDPDHSNFTITLGIDIYCEDNGPPSLDHDTWEALLIKSFNLTFSYKRKVEKFSSVSWNQIGNTISGDNIYVSDANLKFRYTIDQDWPTSLSPFSEIRIIINNNQHPETVRLSSANASWQDAKVGGFDVTNLIIKGANISVSLQVFIANTFSLDNNITISIDDVYLNITYVETFPDYETDSQLFLETLNKTADPFIEIPYGDTVNITIKYQDNQTNHISGANVQLSGKVSGELSENGLLEQYSRIIDSTNLGIGIWLLTITAEMLNYETQVIQLYVKVIERATEIELFVNSQNKSLDPYVQIEVNKIINLTVFYRDDETKAHLSGAEATLIDIGNFSEIGLQFNYTLNSTDLSLGFNVLSIFVQLENYSAQNIQIYVEVYDIATKLELEVDKNPTSPLAKIQVEVNQLINLTVFYKNNETEQHISGATVSLGWDNFTETGTQYYYNLNTTTDLDQGITIVTIEAQLSTFQSQTIQIYFEVVERETEMEVYVDDFKRTEAETILANVNEVLNITVFYKDKISKTHLPGAIVTVLDGNFSEIGNQYNYSLNTNSLDQGITILTVITYLENYQPRSFQFYVEVTERATTISLFLNSIDKTNDSMYELPIGSSLNITVKYSDNQTGAHISGGTVQLIGEDTYNINESLSMNQYTLILDTSDLEDGTDLLTINAHANNYKVQTLSLWLTLNKITTVINTTDGESYYSILPSESILLSIELTDVDFGGTITNAIVTYRWAYGQGNLTDPDNDGIYEGELENIPAGTYEIIITASAGDDYSFDIYRITLNVVSVTPPDFSLLFISLAGGLVALVIGFTLYEVHFKFPPLVRKSRKVRKKISKGKKTKPIKDIASREDLIKEHIDSNVETIQLEKKTEIGLKEK